MNNIDIPPALMNVLVIVIASSDASGNAADGQYTVTTLPDMVTVTRPNTILNYQLIAPTPDALVFVGMEAIAAGGIRQLSNAAVSLDGKMLTLSDLNSVREVINVTLQFSDGMRRLSHDPQVQNSPEQ